MAQVDGATTDEEWDRHKALIRKLYIADNMTLNDLVAYMARTEHFRATRKMYKTRLARWGFTKYNKEDEIKSILSKSIDRAAVGKKSSFYLRGKKVDPEDVERYIKRKGITIRDIIEMRSAGVATPPGLRCLTPEPLVPFPAPPAAFAIPERLYTHIQTYCASSFEDGTWVKTSPQHPCFSKKEGQTSSHTFEDIRDNLINACILVNECLLENRQKIYPEAVANLNYAFSRIRDIVAAENPQAVPRFIEMMILVKAFGRPELVTIVLKQLKRMSAIILGTPAHPMSCIFAALDHLEQEQFEGIALKAWECMNDFFQQYLGSSHLSTFVSKFDRLDTAISSLDAESPGDYLTKILKSGRAHCGSDMLQSTQVLLSLGSYFGDRRRYAEMQEIGQEIVYRTTDWDPADPEGRGLLRLGFDFMATAQFRQCQFEQAMASFELLIELASADLGWADDSKVWDYQAKLEQCLRKLGLASI